MFFNGTKKLLDAPEKCVKEFLENLLMFLSKDEGLFKKALELYRLMVDANALLNK